MTRDPVVIAGLAFIAFMLFAVFPAGVRLARDLWFYEQVLAPFERPRP